jgi:hypothetical protein
VTSRRQFLAGLAGATALGIRPGPLRAQALLPAPRVNGGINLQPVRLLGGSPDTPGIDPAIVDAQLATVYALGFQQARITVSWNRFGNDFFAAIPYVRACRALGLDVVALLSQFSGFDFAQALSQPNVRNGLLRACVDIFAAPVPPAPGVERAGALAFQVLNEPVNSLGVAPGVYLSRLLTPAYRVLKDAAPDVPVIAAAEVGTPEGVLRLRALFAAGLEDDCDEVAYHVYERGVIPLLEGLARKRVRVTESGADGTALHRDWVETVFPEILERIAGVGEIHYFVLHDAAPGRHQLVDLVREPDGGVRVVPESHDLLGLYARRVAEAAAGLPRAAYRDLVPDVTVYFPTAEDVARTREVPPLVFP